MSDTCTAAETGAIFALTSASAVVGVGTEAVVVTATTGELDAPTVAVTAAAAGVAVTPTEAVSGTTDVEPSNAAAVLA